MPTAGVHSATLENSALLACAIALSAIECDGRRVVAHRAADTARLMWLEPERTHAMMMLSMSGRHAALVQCEWCRCLIVPPEDETETQLCVRCSVGFEQHPIWEDDTADRIADLQKLDVYSDSRGPTCTDGSMPNSPRSSNVAEGQADTSPPKQTNEEILYNKIQKCIVEIPQRTSVPVESECPWPAVPSVE